MGSNLLGYEYRGYSMGVHDIWKYPDYRFTIPKGSKNYKEITIKVIDSVPNSNKTKDTLSNVLKQVLKELPDTKTVIDFGAGKLRNTEFLLKKGCKVYAVEFEEMQTKTDKAKKIYEDIKRHKPNYKSITFPHEFSKKRIKVDLVIAVNVHNVMPVPAERLLLLQYCRMKLKNNGYFLYYGQHDDPDTMAKNTNENKIGDGHYSHSEYTYQTFYHNYKKWELDVMFLANGFRQFKKYDAGLNHALLYKISGNVPLANTLNGKLIRKYIQGSERIEKKSVGILNLKKSDNPITNFPIVKELQDECLFINALNKLPFGTKHATTYHNLIAAILLKLFSPNLEDIKIEQKINNADDRPDIILRNHAENGFFNRRQDGKIIFECKNYRSGVGEGIKQINGRFNNRIGKFGIICYRRDEKQNDYKNLVKHCKTHLDNDHHILCLNDNDMIKMLEYKLNGESPDKIIQEKHDELTDL